MQSALYYPFTRPKSELFLKTALFLWDSVDFIVPFDGFKPRGKSDEEIEALEIIGRPYVPTEKDKRNAHEELEKICDSPISKKLNFKLENPDENYDFYPEKLLDETWRMLSQSQLAKVVTNDSNVSHASTGRLFGYYMMTILAVCCSQGEKRLVTDENDIYRTLANVLGDSASSNAAKDDWHGRLIALTLKGPDFGDIPLKKLLDLRKTENELLTVSRRNFLDQVDKTALDIAKNADNHNIVRERIRQYTDYMENNLKELKRALRRSATSTLLSKEFGFSLLAATAAVTFEPISGGIATVGGLAKGLMDYQDRRRDLLRKHPSAWPLMVGSGRIPFV